MSGYDAFERDLFASVTTNATARPVSPPSLLARFSRKVRASPLVTLVVVAALGGTATAGVLSLQGTPTPPLTGTSAGAPLPGTTAQPGTENYTVALYPSLRAGETGWCSVLTLDSAAGPRTGGLTCGPTFASEVPLIRGGGLGRVSGSIYTAIVGSEVAGVRFAGGPIILTRQDPDLPRGLRFAIGLTDADGDAPWTYYGFNGAEFPTPDDVDRWLIPRQQTSPGLSSPLGTLHIPSDLTVRSSTRISDYTPAALTQRDPAFLPAVTATIQRGRHTYTAALVVNGIDPSSPANDLPGMREATHGLFTSTSRQITRTAKRAGNRWIIVQGPNADDRAAIIGQLSAD